MRLVCSDDFRPRVVSVDGTNELIARFDGLRVEVDRRRQAGGGRAVPRRQPARAHPASWNFLAAPVNYLEHGAEMQGPMATNAGTARELGLCVKTDGSVSGEADGVELPPIDGWRFDHEAEIGVVIGGAARGVACKSALEHVFGYTLILDGTMRLTAAAREERTLRKSFGTLALRVRSRGW